MNRYVKAALKGAAILWCTFAICTGIVLLAFLCGTHPYVGIPIAITLVGAFFGWLYEADDGEDCDW
jgi:hypothetical protein